MCRISVGFGRISDVCKWWRNWQRSGRNSTEINSTLFSFIPVNSQNILGQGLLEPGGSLLLWPPPTPERRCSMLLVIGSSAGRQIISASSLSHSGCATINRPALCSPQHTQTRTHILAPALENWVQSCGECGLGRWNWGMGEMGLIF